MARYRDKSRGLQTRSARGIEVVRKALPDGKVRCGACDAVTSVTKSGRLRKHQTPRREPCPNIISGITKRIEVMPEVRLPAIRQGRGRSEKRPEKRPENEPARLDVGTGCRECGKWLPGERSLCGACYVKREASR